MNSDTIYTPKPVVAKCHHVTHTFLDFEICVPPTTFYTLTKDTSYQGDLIPLLPPIDPPSVSYSKGQPANWLNLLNILKGDKYSPQLKFVYVLSLDL